MEKEYFRIHNWLSYHHGKAFKCENELCESKNPKKFEWALLKGREYTKDRNNYIMLCPSCHRKYDYKEETRSLQSKIAKGRTFSKTTLSKISAALKGKNTVKIGKYNLNGVLIQEYESVSIAAKEHNVSQSAISNCLIGTTKTSGGFKWHYKQMS